MYGSPTGGKAEYFYFYGMHRSKFIFLGYFLKKDEEFSFFRLISVYSLMHNELLGNRSDKYYLKGPRNKIKVHNLNKAPSLAHKLRESN